MEDVPVEVLTWRLGATAPAPTVTLRFTGINETGQSAIKGIRNVRFPDVGSVETTVWDRYLLKAGDTFEGPAVVEERESTTVLGPGTRVRVDDALNLHVELGSG